MTALISTLTNDLKESLKLKRKCCVPQKNSKELNIDHSYFIPNKFLSIREEKKKNNFKIKNNFLILLYLKIGLGYSSLNF